MQTVALNNSLFLTGVFLDRLALCQQAAHCTPIDLDPHPVCYFQGDCRIGQTGDLAVNAAGGKNDVTLLEIGEHRFVFFLFFLLGPDEEKIENREHCDH